MNPSPPSDSKDEMTPASEASPSGLAPAQSDAPAEPRPRQEAASSAPSAAAQSWVVLGLTLAVGTAIVGVLVELFFS